MTSHLQFRSLFTWQEKVRKRFSLKFPFRTCLRLTRILGEVLAPTDRHLYLTGQLRNRATFDNPIKHPFLFTIWSSLDKSCTIKKTKKARKHARLKQAKETGRKAVVAEEKRGWFIFFFFFLGRSPAALLRLHNHWLLSGCSGITPPLPSDSKPSSCAPRPAYSYVLMPAALYCHSFSLSCVLVAWFSRFSTNRLEATWISASLFGFCCRVRSGACPAKTYLVMWLSACTCTSALE